MDNNYCPECGNKLEKDAAFCSNCAFKIKQNNKTKFCSACGEKIDFNAEICPKCGVRLLNPLTNSLNDTFDKATRKTEDFREKYVTARNITIVFLIFIIFALIAATPLILEAVTPYEEVDESYIANPVPGEKVQFDGVYVGHTTWSAGSYFYSPITDNDVVRVGSHYVIIQGDYLNNDLYGHEGRTVHLEGRFAPSEKSKEPLEDMYIYGYWFGADSIEIVE